MPGTAARRGWPGAAVLAVAFVCGSASAVAASPVFIEVGPVKVNKTKRTATVPVTTGGDLAKPAECSLDTGSPVPCQPLMRFTNLRRGRHVLRVEAAPADGSPVTAVTKAFVVSPKKKGRKHGGKRT